MGRLARNFERATRALSACKRSKAVGHDGSRFRLERHAMGKEAPKLRRVPLTPCPPGRLWTAYTLPLHRPTASVWSSAGSSRSPRRGALRLRAERAAQCRSGRRRGRSPRERSTRRPRIRSTTFRPSRSGPVTHSTRHASSPGVTCWRAAPRSSAPPRSPAAPGALQRPSRGCTLGRSLRPPRRLSHGSRATRLSLPASTSCASCASLPCT